MSNGDCCEGLKEQLSALTTEVNRVKQEFQKANQQLGQANKRIGNLENKLKKLEQGEENNSNIEIFKRLSKLESYCDSLEQVLARIAEMIKPITAIFK